MDAVTEDVRALYTEYPFPSEVYEYSNELGLEVFRHFIELSQRTGRNLLEGDILDAGCGTGQNAVSIGMVFPGARVLGVDMTEASLQRARAYANEKRTTNVRFECADLLQLNLNQEFDAIFCIGVLHHLSDPVRGLRSLRAHLASGGRIVLWLYGKHGRARLHLNQQFLRLLFKEIDDLSEKVRLTKELLRNAPDECLHCYFSVPAPALEQNWKAAKDWVLGKDEWLVDQFLHVNERAVDMTDVLQMLDETGLEIENWVGGPKDVRALLGSDGLLELFEKLSKTEQLVAVDLLLKPNVYVVVARSREDG